jgi:hypothetical protein
MAITRLGGANAITGTIPTSVAPGKGKVLQVVQTGTRYYQTFGSTSFTDMETSSGVTFESAITPSTTSNKILIIPNINVRAFDSAANESRYKIKAQFKVGSGSYADTILGSIQMGAYDYGAHGILIAQMYSNNYLLSANTTDEVKIKFQLAKFATDVNLNTNPTNTESLSTVTLMEIQA